MKKRIFYTLTTFLWMAFIFYMSSQTAEVSGEQSDAITRRIIGFFIYNPSESLVGTIETVIRKMCHFSEYALLSFLSFKMLVSYGLNRKNTLYAVLIAVVYAVSDEIHQYFIPGRACRLFDIFLDSLGALTGWYITNRFSRKN
ncbi:MAG: VanZ family protein [Clostridia bacterium]|nr:VanZ family protein [Clostridia bacterium]